MARKCLYLFWTISSFMCANIVKRFDNGVGEMAFFFLFYVFLVGYNYPFYFYIWKLNCMVDIIAVQLSAENEVIKKWEKVWFSVWNRWNGGRNGWLEKMFVTGVFIYIYTWGRLTVCLVLWGHERWAARGISPRVSIHAPMWGAATWWKWPSMCGHGFNPRPYVRGDSI